MSYSGVFDRRLRAQYIFFHDYYFVPDGIIRIPIVSPLLLLASFSVTIFFVWLLGTQFHYLAASAVFTDNGLIGLAIIVVSTLPTGMVADFRRRRIQQSSSEQLGFLLRNSTFIPWSDVVEMGKSASVWIWVKSGKSTYSMTSSSSLRKEILAFAQGKHVYIKGR